MKWEVVIAKKASKRAKKLPFNATAAFHLLWRDLQEQGPVLKNWPNFSKLRASGARQDFQKHWHCHLKKGKPTFVVCWRSYEYSEKEKIDKKKKGKIEIYYAWTHEGAPY